MEKYGPLAAIIFQALAIIWWAGVLSSTVERNSNAVLENRQSAKQLENRLTVVETKLTRLDKLETKIDKILDEIQRN